MPDFAVGRTTIARNLIELIQVGKADKAAVLASLGEATAGSERLRVGEPALTVHLHQLREDASPPPPPPSSIARGTKMAPIVSYDRVASMSLYALGDASRVDVLRFGRHPDQDLQLLDRLVSREHGLVIFSGAMPLFCDYGTLIDGAHAGSTNGTYLDGATRISDTMITWLPSNELMCGTRYTRGRTQVYAFKLSYELHPNAFKPTTN